MTPNENLLPPARVQLFQSGAVFDPAMDFDEWRRAMTELAKIGKLSQWALGAGVNFARHKFIEQAGSDRGIYAVKCREAISTLSPYYEYETLQNMAWVEANVPRSLRSDRLSFRHHATVAPLPPEKQKKYLRLAVKNKLSVADLNELIRASEAEVITDDSQPVTKPGPLEWASRLSLWAKQQLSDVEQWPLARVRVVESDVRAVAELHRKLQARLERAGAPARAGLLSR